MLTNNQYNIHRTLQRGSVKSSHSLLREEKTHQFTDTGEWGLTGRQSDRLDSGVLDWSREARVQRRNCPNVGRESRANYNLTGSGFIGFEITASSLYCGSHWTTFYFHTYPLGLSTRCSLATFSGGKNSSHLRGVLEPTHTNTFPFSVQRFDRESNPGHLILVVILYGNYLLCWGHQEKDGEEESEDREISRKRKTRQQQQTSFHPSNRDNDILSI